MLFLSLLAFSFQNFNSDDLIYVFRSDNQAGGKYYRIPSIVTDNKTKYLIAFAEERFRHNSDSGDINVVYKVSTDNGANWSKKFVVCELKLDTCGNPTAVVNQVTGRVHLFMNSNKGYKRQFEPQSDRERFQVGDRRILYTSGTFNGDQLIFQNILDLTDDLQFRNTKFDLVGPGVGIQITKGRYKNRLIIPAARRTMYSDDDGKTWTMSRQQMSDLGSETAIVELKTGEIYRNDRLTKKHSRPDYCDDNVYREVCLNRRVTSLSSDGGDYFTNPKKDYFLIDPVSQGSLLKYTDDNIIFANCASTKLRNNLTLRLSTNNAKTWKSSKKIDNDCGYSSMTKTRDYKVGILYEKSNGFVLEGKHVKDLVFKKFPLGFFNQ